MPKRSTFLPAIVLFLLSPACGNLPRPGRDAASGGPADLAGWAGIRRDVGLPADLPPLDQPDAAPDAQRADVAVTVGDASATDVDAKLDTRILADAPADGAGLDLPPDTDLPAGDASPDGTTNPISRIYACGELLEDSANLLERWRDPWTGLPYDNIPCGGKDQDGSVGNRVNPAAGVIPQLANGARAAFSEDSARTDAAVTWSFDDRDPDNQLPSMVFAFRIALHLDEGGEAGPANRYAGITWQANTDIRRYARVKIRYRTSSTSNAWQLKLRSGAGAPVEPAVTLHGSTTWTDAVFTIADDFAGTDAEHLDYLTFSGSVVDGDREPELWIDHLSFLPDVDQLSDCTISCYDPLPAYPDLACLEPQTGVVNIANAITFFALAPSASLVDDAAAEAAVATILDSLEKLPGASPTSRANGQPYDGGGWFQDWHSPASLMPDPRNHKASLTDQPQLFAALMIAEQTWPALASRAAALRAKMDFSVLYDDRQGCPGTLSPAIDRCAGLTTDWSVGGFGTDYLLGVFLAGATGAVPPCYWSSGLSAGGCALSGPVGASWYTTGNTCADAAIPATEGGGPFMQLAGLLYLVSDQVPVGTLPLADSARNMLRAQYEYAKLRRSQLAGWSSATDPDSCGYMTCSSFVPEKVTPYVSAMAAGDDFPEAYDMLRAFHLLGADAMLDTGLGGIALGLRDAWNLTSATSGDSYLYLDTGWSVLGLLNACHQDVVRQRFGEHPLALAGYMLTLSSHRPCP